MKMPGMETATEERPIIVVDASLDGGYFGIGMMVDDGRAGTPYDHGARAEEGKDATHYEREAVLYAIRHCREAGITGAIIYNDNLLVILDINEEGFDVRHMKNESANPAIWRMHNDAHEHANKRRKRESWNQ